jgi:hypothetical protein
MKKYIFCSALLLSLVCSCARLSAQQPEAAQTLFGKKSVLGSGSPGFFVVPTIGVTRMDGYTTGLFNIHGGVTLADRFSFGAFFQTNLNDIFPESETVTDVYMDYWGAGGFASYTLLSDKVIHLSFPLFVGYNEIEMDRDDGSAGLGESNFLHVEPCAFLEVNLHEHVRLNLGAGYRLVQEMNYRNMNQSDLSGITGYVGLKLGLFR